MKFLKISDRVIIIVSSILVVLLTLFITIIPLTCSKNYYNQQFKKNNTLQELTHSYYDDDGVYQTTTYTEEDLDIIITSIIDYLMDKKDDMQVIINDKEVFSVQAIEHMKDVKVLYQNGMHICYVLFVIFILNIVYLVIRRKDVNDKIFKYSMGTLGVVLVFALIMGVWMIIDFDNAFIFFHKVAFPNPADFNDAFFGYRSNYPEKCYIDNLLLVTVLDSSVFMDAGFFIIGGLVVNIGLWSLYGILAKKASKKHLE